MDEKIAKFINFDQTKGTQFKVNEEEYANIQPYIDTISAASKLTYKSLYIIDYYKNEFLYVSDNPLFLCGFTAKEVKKQGYSFYANHIPEEDLSFLIQINKEVAIFLRKIEKDKKRKYSISYNFHLQKKTKEKILINHQIIPLKLSEEGYIWLALCVVSLAPSQETGVACIKVEDSDKLWYYKHKEAKWKEYKSLKFSEIEKTIIRMANRGLSTEKIAERINKSKDSVKKYRKNIFDKLDVTNISEAIAMATHMRLL